MTTKSIDNLKKFRIIDGIISDKYGIEGKSDMFFNIQILKRKKDDASINKNSKLLKTFNVCLWDSYNTMEKLYPEIKKICEQENARAMVNLQPKSYEKVNIKAVKKLLENMEYHSYKHLVDNTKGFMQSIIDDSTTSSLSYNNIKFWVVDIDRLVINEENGGILEDDITFNQRVKTIKKFIENKIGKKQMGMNIEIVIEEFPSKNGLHLITRPFDVKYFTDNFEKETGLPIESKPEIKKQGLTNLYIP